MRIRDKNPDLRRRVYDTIAKIEGRKQILARQHKWISPNVQTDDIQKSIQADSPEIPSTDVWNAMRWLRRRELIVEDVGNGWSVQPLPKNGICWLHGKECIDTEIQACPACAK